MKEINFTYSELIFLISALENNTTNEKYNFRQKNELKDLINKIKIKEKEYEEYLLTMER